MVQRRRLEDSLRSPQRQYIDRTRPFPVDVEDRGEAFVVSADLPGLRTQDLDVSARKQTVQITATFGEEEEEPGTYHRRERPRGEVQRVIHLPRAIDEKRVSASYNDGILRVTLQKRRRGTRVEIE